LTDNRRFAARLRSDQVKRRTVARLLVG